MSTIDGIVRLIVESLVGSTHKTLADAAMKSGGIEIPDESTGLSKRERILASLQNMSQSQIAEVGRRIGSYSGRLELEENANILLEQGSMPISEPDYP